MSMKDAYQKKLQAHLDEWNAEIDKLKAKADAADADAQIQYNKQIESLREKQETAREKVNEVQRASDDAWEDLKAGVDRAWDDLRDAVDSARSRFG